MDTITLAHGAGGVLSERLIADVFRRELGNRFLEEADDAAVVGWDRRELVVTTDSFVVDPIFFPGGDIGKLAVCGTVNDLAACGAEPVYLTAGFILEEGLLLSDLRRVVRSMATAARRHRVLIVAGDTKVVARGKVDKIFINTTGIGRLYRRLRARDVRPGDKILISGSLAEHGLSVLMARERLPYAGKVQSDCEGLWGIVKWVLQHKVPIHFMRDPTRGGLGGVLHEIAQMTGCSVVLREADLPVTRSCRALSDILGLDILDIANEGKMCFVVKESAARRTLDLLRSHPLGRKAAIIGAISDDRRKQVVLETVSGGRVLVGRPVADPIPRIC
jgi:hydrogenase expression/formation protein HypE